MKARDLFSDELHARRPILRKHRIVGRPPDGRYVVEERVEPYVDNAIIAIAGNWNSPCEISSRDREVVESFFKERQHFVVHAAWAHPIRVVAEIREQAIAVF